MLWGCGAGCITGLMVDARSGRVHDLPDYLSVGAAYRADSRLFVADPPEEIADRFAPEDVPAGLHPRYFVWADSGVVALDTLPAR